MLALGLALCTAPLAPADTCDAPARTEALVDSTEALAADGALDASLNVFAEAFAQSVPDRWDAYGAARIAGRTGRAVGYLHQAVEAGFDRPGFAAPEPDLEPVRASGLWPEIVDAIHRENARRSPGSCDGALARQLTAIYVEDQRVRRVWQQSGRRHGFPIPDSVLAPIQSEVARVDSLLLLETAALLDVHGWPESSKVSSEGATAVFVVVQHAPLAVQERYLPVMRAAVEAGEADAGLFVLLADRVRNGDPQLYGTQCWHDPESGERVSFPIEDGIDPRLETLGQGSFREAVEAQGQTWPVRAGWPDSEAR